MSEVVESVDIEVGIVVSETAKKAIEEVQKELDKITDAGAPGGSADVTPAINEALDAAVDNATGAADKIIDELERITDAGRKAVDEAAVWQDDGGGGAVATPTVVQPIEEAGAAAETVIDRLDQRVKTLADTIVANFGDANGGIAGFFGRWAESSKQKFGEIIESGRHAANVLEEAFGKNIYTDAISGMIGLLEKTESLGAGLTSLGASVSKWAPQIGGAITAAGTAVSSAVPVVVGGAAQMAAGVASFAVQFAGPIGAVTAVVGGLGYAWYKAGQDSKKAIEEMAKVQIELDKLEAGASRSSDNAFAGEGRERTAAFGESVRSALENVDLGDYYEAFRKIADEFGNAAQEEFDRRAALIASGDVRAGGTEAGNKQELLAATEAERDLAKETLDIARQKFAALQQQTAEAQKQLDLQRKEAELALDVLERQEQARQSVQEKLGRLEAGQQEEVLNLLQEIQSGNATGEQVAQFEKLFGAIDETRKFYAEQSTATVDQLDALGAKLSEQDAKLLAAAEKLAGGKGIEAIQKFLEKLADDEEKLNTTMAEATKELETTTAELTELIASLTKTINTMKTELEELKFRQRNGGGGV